MVLYFVNPTINTVRLNVLNSNFCLSLVVSNKLILKPFCQFFRSYLNKDFFQVQVQVYFVKHYRNK